MARTRFESVSSYVGMMTVLNEVVVVVTVNGGAVWAFNSISPALIKSLRV